MSETAGCPMPGMGKAVTVACSVLFRAHLGVLYTV